MGEGWQRQANTIAEQARFSVITESKKDIKKILSLLENPLILHISIYTADGSIFYSSGQINSCIDENHETKLIIEKNNYWCLGSMIKNNYDKEVVGNVLLIVSKKEVKELIKKNLLSNLIVVSLLTFIIFGLLYFLTKRLTAPLAKLSYVMKKVANKERGIQIDTEGTLDIRGLQDSFNKMLLEIERYEKNLEEKVNERTKALTIAYEKAQGASKIKSDMLKIVSHEMKTPLHNAMYSLSLMSLGKGDFTSQIKNSHDQLKVLIDNLLEYFQAEDSKLILKNKQFCPSSLLDNIFNNFNRMCLARENQLDLTCDFQGDVFSDEQKIKQIVINLLDNANKHTRQGNITMTCEDSCNRLIITISDTGTGISEKNIEKIFKPFWQVDMSSSRVHQGIGLGLTICQLFAENLGGNIKVTSQEKKGSKFILVIPMIKPMSNSLKENP
jgi:signal transduction histidine kinase